MPLSNNPSPQAAERKNDWKAMSLGLICGYVDAYTLLTLKVFTSFMSGNTTSAGMKAGQAERTAWHDFLPIPCFLLGAFLGALLQQKKTPRATALVLLEVASLLAVGAIASRVLPEPSLRVVLFSVAMGVLNTTLSRVGGQTVNLGFVTGDLKNLGEHLAGALSGEPLAGSQGAWDTHGRRAFTLSTVWTSFLIGAFLGGLLANRLLGWTLLLPIAGLVLLAAPALTGKPARA